MVIREYFSFFYGSFLLFHSFINVKSNMALNLQQSQGVSQDGLAITGKTSDQGAYQTWALEKINV